MQFTKIKMATPSGVVKIKNALATYADSEKIKKEQALQHAEYKKKRNENNIQYVTRAIEKAREELAYQKRSLKSVKKTITETTRETEKAKKALTKHKIRKDIQAHVQKEYARLLKHKAVHHVVVTSDYIKIFLQPLWTDIRKEEGSKEMRRTFLGCFVIEVPIYQVNGIRIRNLTFVTSNAHWSIQSGTGNPCWGDWREQIETCIKARNVTGLITILIPYLQSTEDGGAYIRSHYWKECRRINVIKNSVQHPVHQTVVCAISYTDYGGNQMQGLPAYKVYNTNRSVYQFLAPVTFNVIENYSRYDDSLAPLEKYKMEGKQFYSFTDTDDNKFIPVDETELDKQLLKYKDLPDAEKREKLRAWGMEQIVKHQKTHKKILKSDVFAYVDKAHTLAYEDVAQPLEVNEVAQADTTALTGETVSGTVVTTSVGIVDELTF